MTDPADILRDPLVAATDALSAAFTPTQAAALLAWAELLVERLDGRTAAMLLGSRRRCALCGARVARMERRQDIADLVVFGDPLSPY
jgi:hypothetical protein